MLVRDLILIYCLFLLIRHSSGLCTYPRDLRGTWYDSVYGTIAFTDSSMNMETKTFVSGFTNTNFTCQLNNGDMYVSKSNEAVTLGILGGFTVNIWICFEIKSLTTSSFYYYLRSSDQDNLNFGDVVPVATTVTTVTEADICNTSPGVGEFHMIVNPASAKEGLSAVPVPLLGDFTYTMNFGTASSECGVSAFWEGCSNTTIITLNNTACGSQFVGYSASGSLGCIKSVQDTTSTSVYYVGVYNFDTSVNGASTKRFTCFTVEYDTSITMVSQSPNKCSPGSSPTDLPTDGALLQLTTVRSCECSGELCDKDDCADQPCQYGKCVDEIDDFYCDCMIFFNGKTCNKLTPLAIAFVSLAALGLLLIGCCSYWKIAKVCKDDEKGKVKPMKETIDKNQ